MQSIYLRSLRTRDVSRFPETESVCDYCHRYKARERLGPFRFCCISCANGRHMEVDLGAASRTVHLLIVLARQALPSDVTLLIGRVLYTHWKRSPPSHLCHGCGYQAEPTPQFVDSFCFCDTQCRKAFFGQMPRHHKGLLTQSKDIAERTSDYGAIW